MAITEKLKPLIERADQQLDLFLSEEHASSAHLLSAMRYSVFNGGKRIRPVLVYAAGQALHCPPADCDAPAVAVELIHAYSLIHDDLPAMDDDDLRRGKPTCHIQYDEATAILAGDALQTSAFSVLLNAPQQPGQLAILQELAKASGSQGMVAGQMIDLEAVGKDITLSELENMHRHKTGALIQASVRMGALAGGANAVQLKALDVYAAALGLAFQVQDDILDVESDTETLGKQQGADIALNKPTYVSLLGLEQAKEKARHLTDTALQSLDDFGPEADLLRELARYVVERNY